MEAQETTPHPPDQCVFIFLKNHITLSLKPHVTQIQTSRPKRQSGLTHPLRRNRPLKPRAFDCQRGALSTPHRKSVRCGWCSCIFNGFESVFF